MRERRTLVVGEPITIEGAERVIIDPRGNATFDLIVEREREQGPRCLSCNKVIETWASIAIGVGTVEFRCECGVEYTRELLLGMDREAWERMRGSDQVKSIGGRLTVPFTMSTRSSQS